VLAACKFRSICIPFDLMSLVFDIGHAVEVCGRWYGPHGPLVMITCEPPNRSWLALTVRGAWQLS